MRQLSVTMDGHTLQRTDLCLTLFVLSLRTPCAAIIDPQGSADPVLD